MKSGLIALLALVVVLGVVPLSAHEGHTHLVMGTVTSLSPKSLEIETKDAKKVSVVLRDDTLIRKGTAKAVLADVKEGERVVVEAEQEKDLMIAKVIRLGAAATAPAKAPVKSK